MMPMVESRKKVIQLKDVSNSNGELVIDKLKSEMAHESIFEVSDFEKLIKKFKHIINNEANFIKINDPVVVIGDIHGQLFDFLKILSGFEREILKITAVFLGDYVDRGLHSIEVMTMLMALKIQFPKNIILLRGNHESEIMTSVYNFKRQCCEKYNQHIYSEMIAVFNCLPLACLINNKYFCVHGGISDKLTDANDINSIQRKIQIPLDGPFCDFIWSDPTIDEKGKMNYKSVRNVSRDCSIVYGEELATEFLKKNYYSTIIRGHEAVIEGYKAHNWSKDKKAPPTVMTVFSAPNYLGSENKSAVLRIENDKMKIKQYHQEQPANHKLSVHFDVFSWTLPQALVKSQQIVISLMNRIVEVYIPELQEQKQDKRVEAFLKYYKHSNAKTEDVFDRRFSATSIITTKKHLDQNSEREQIFNRSHDYYAKTEMRPKQNENV